MIITFSSKDTELIWNGYVSKKFPSAIQQTARRKLVHIHAAVSINDLRVPPGNRLEKLKASDFYSIRINDQWRIVFRWVNRNAFEVEIIDYH